MTSQRGLQRTEETQAAKRKIKKKTKRMRKGWGGGGGVSLGVRGYMTTLNESYTGDSYYRKGETATIQEKNASIKTVHKEKNLRTRP